MRKELSHVILELHNVRMKPSNVRKKIKEPPNSDKRTVTCNVGIAQCEDETVKYKKKKVREPPNVRKELLHAILELHNVGIKLPNMKKKIREPPNERKELSHVIFELHNVRIEPSNVRKK